MNTQYLEWMPQVLSVARAAANAIRTIYSQQTFQIESKLDNSPVTEADLAAHRIILAGLQKIDPMIPILSEEGPNIPFETRRHWSRYWLVDPLDGTREFIRRRDEFVVNIALIEGHQPVLGVIAVPIFQQSYWAVCGDNAYFQIEGQDPALIHSNHESRSPLKVVISRRDAEKIKTTEFDLEKRFGSYDFNYCGSALKICLVARGEVDLYPRFSASYEWDTAAGQCILEAAGGQLIDLSGAPLRYNTKSSLENPGFYAIGDPSLRQKCCG